MTNDDVLWIADLLAKVAREEVIPRFKALAPGDIHLKTSIFDPVTEADEAAERAITVALLERWPGALIVGEEATAKDPSLLTKIADAELSFVVDPIDGTRNFIAGLPLFGVMAAAIVRGEVVAGVIHDPMFGDTAHGLKGQGAWLSRFGEPPVRLRVAAPGPLERMEGLISSHYLPEPLRSTVLGNMPRLGAATSLRCAAHEYRTAASGFCHILSYWKLMPWDHGPGWLLHQEAGGYSAHLDGSPYRPSNTTGGLLCTPDRDSWLLVREALYGDSLPPVVPV